MDFLGAYEENPSVRQNRQALALRCAHRTWRDGGANIHSLIPLLRGSAVFAMTLAEGIAFAIDGAETPRGVLAATDQGPRPSASSLELRQVTLLATGATENATAFRVGAFLAIDITILPF